MFDTAYGHANETMHPLDYGRNTAEPVVVMPCDRRSTVGKVTMDDVAFATRCAFSWRTEREAKLSPIGRVSFTRHVPTAAFDRTGLRYPQVGDLVTRSWDGVTFEVIDVSLHGSRDIVCGLAELHPKLH